MLYLLKNAGQSSLVARKAHNLEVAGSNPAPAKMLFKFNSYFNLTFLLSFSKCCLFNKYILYIYFTNYFFLLVGLLNKKLK